MGMREQEQVKDPFGAALGRKEEEIRTKKKKKKKRSRIRFGAISTAAVLVCRRLIFLDR